MRRSAVMLVLLSLLALSSSRVFAMGGGAGGGGGGPSGGSSSSSGGPGGNGKDHQGAKVPTRSQSGEAGEIREGVVTLTIPSRIRVPPLLRKEGRDFVVIGLNL